MEFAWSPEQQAFRERVRSFLRAELPADWTDIASQSPGSLAVTNFSLEFCPKLAAAGLLVPHWPVEYGGAGATPWEHFILGEEMWRMGEPRGPQYYNVNWLGPSIMKYGSAAQKDEHLSLIAAGKAIWCQGFSEPSAGSDLAAMRTRADAVDGGYRINGSKIWTSYASLAEYCFLLAKTSQGKAGVSVFLLPMSTPGIEVHKIPSVVGDGDIHEVFFTDVFAPADCLLGAEGQGWEIARYALHFERVGIPRYALARRVLEEIVATLDREGRFADAHVRTRAGQSYAICESARMLVYRVLDQRAKAMPQSAETSIARYAVVQAERTVAEFALDFLPEAMRGIGQKLIDTHHKRAITAGIAAGAAEIQLNLIADQLLHLPRA
ncbi:MAG TPA: acyl-CoA dehydrogenase family protein [Sphingobium sp.]|nr:acyl-CoA dehydrogenase family protein [Sphingobium sp.]